MCVNRVCCFTTHKYHTIVNEAVVFIFTANPNNCCRKILVAILKLMFQTLTGMDHQVKTSKIDQIEGAFKEGMLFSFLFYYS